MKKLAFVCVIAFLAIGTVSAQWGGGWGTPVQVVTVTGTLQLQSGTIAVVSGSNVYFVPALAQYIGFIDGLREGAEISVDGYLSGTTLQPTKFTIGGRAYDFTAATQLGFGGGYGYCGGGGWGNSRMVSGRGGCGGWW